MDVHSVSKTNKRGFVVVLGCSTLSDKDQKMVKDAVEIAEAIDTIVGDGDK